VLKRIKALAIRPAWTDVWICPFADGHIQATGRDAKGPQAAPVSRALSRGAGTHEVRACRRLRRRAACHPGKSPGASGPAGIAARKGTATFWRPRSSASETTKYAERNNSYGLTTLQNRHVAVDGNEVRFRFTGKTGKQWSLGVRYRRIAKSCLARNCSSLWIKRAIARTPRRPT
jgi:DNA topoisomerase I